MLYIIPVVLAVVALRPSLISAKVLKGRLALSRRAVLIVKTVTVQSMCVLLVVGISSFENKIAVFSSLLGGLVFIVASTWFAIRSFTRRAHKAEQVVFYLYLAEVEKFSIVIVALVTIFLLMDQVDPLALFAGFFAAQISGLVVSAKLFSQSKKV